MGHWDRRTIRGGDLHAGTRRADVRPQSTDSSFGQGSATLTRHRRAPRSSTPEVQLVIPGISDNTSEALLSSIRGLDTRAAAIKDNIANVETPGYQAKRVAFEGSLSRALSAGNPAAATASESRSLAPTRLNGNNVAIDQEMTQLTETELRQQLSINALNAKYRLLRTAITGD
jgi:flagellar basal-body rod protein FlgB